MMLDFDLDVVAFAAKPFWLYWSTAQRQDGRHAPDFFARLGDGGGAVVDVLPGPAAGAKLACGLGAISAACREVGWAHRSVGGPSDVLVSNVRWLAGYRHPRCFDPDIAQGLIKAFAEPTPLLGRRRGGG